MHALGFEWQLAVLLVATVGPPGALCAGNVGCLFSETLCVDQEWCYDDQAFGRCLPAFGSVVDDDLFKHELDRQTLHTFEKELGRLFALGYRWSHGYTQCELQAMLYSARQGIDFDNTVCSDLADQDLEGALKSLESEEQVDPDSMAFVRYTPSDKNPHADFADEVYYPQMMTGIEPDLRSPVEDEGLNDDYDIPYGQIVYPEIVKRTWIPAMHRRSLAPMDYYTQPSENDVQFLTDEDNSIPYEETQQELNTPSLQDLQQFVPFVDYLTDMQITADDVQYLLQPEHVDELQKIVDGFFKEYEQAQVEKVREQMLNEWIKEENLAYLQKQLMNKLNDKLDEMSSSRFTRKYNTPDRFRSGWESKDEGKPLLDNNDSSDLYESRVYIDESEPEFFHEETGSGEHRPHEIFRELKDQQKFYFDEPNEQPKFEVPGILRRVKGSDRNEENKSGVFTEGGVVYVPNSQVMGEFKPIPERLKQDLEFLEDYDWGFKRKERLDVKKPGPPFNEHTAVATEQSVSNVVPLMEKKGPRATHPDPQHDQYDVDTDCVYIGVKDSIRTWKVGRDIVGNISKMLHLEPKSLTHPRVDRNEVTFRVGPNKFNLNATEVAKRIELIKDKLNDQFDIEIISAGVGDKTKMPAIMTVENPDVPQMYMMVTILSIIASIVLLAGLILFLIKAQILYRRKIHDLAHPDTEASKDYQDLCRARMATKAQQQSTEKTEGIHGRITSLSRESEGSQHSPSSRSSTSSWSEEPTLTNMDISTGHMVLTYMEDHLKNKDRLDQEWVALCAYEAEPCSTSVALKPDNVKKNRYMEVLPYDHARVVLNVLANMSSSDYINASSITDHDPRNPAYIATQGPLPNTAPDFWQMVWEQGSVVMVMLTRLTENGNAMCHRYWPEEGSDLYHIYEVHLVSEHIWCDDYLVRSFYLKNVRTGETRTVTQFHFLSWPDHGIPTSTKALLEFRRKVNKSYRGRSCPIVVHCSDGAGRTGTYCLIDMVLNRMAKGAKEIDIAATLEHIRDQRPAMVASKQQFEFVLMAVAEEVHAILKALPAQLQQQQDKKDAEAKDKEKQ